jgi:hypothetical protein
MKKPARPCHIAGIAAPTVRMANTRAAPEPGRSARSGRLHTNAEPAAATPQHHPEGQSPVARRTLALEHRDDERHLGDVPGPEEPVADQQSQQRAQRQRPRSPGDAAGSVSGNDLAAGAAITSASTRSCVGCDRCGRRPAGTAADRRGNRRGVFRGRRRADVAGPPPVVERAPP